METKRVTEETIYECFAAAGEGPTLNETAGSFVDVEEYENAVMYPSFARWAQKGGYPELAKLFSKVAGEELLHAKWMRELHQEMGEPPAGEDTIRAKKALKAINLNMERLLEESPETMMEKALSVAIRVENREWQEIYPAFRDQAVAAGNRKAADVYQRVIDSEREHAVWFEAALKDFRAKREIPAEV